MSLPADTHELIEARADGLSSRDLGTALCNLAYAFGLVGMAHGEAVALLQHRGLSLTEAHAVAAAVARLTS